MVNHSDSAFAVDMNDSLIVSGSFDHSVNVYDFALNEQQLDAHDVYDEKKEEESKQQQEQRSIFVSNIRSFSSLSPTRFPPFHSALFTPNPLLISDFNERWSNNTNTDSSSTLNSSFLDVPGLYAVPSQQQKEGLEEVQGVFDND